MKTKNYANGDGIPLGLGMALAQNSKAMEYFASLPDSEKQRIIQGTHSLNSKEEMQMYVEHLAENKIL